MLKFFKTLGLSVYPMAYHKFCKKSFGAVLSYFLGVILVGLLLCNILLIPFYVGLPDLIFREIGQFSSFNITNDVEMTGPIEWPKQDPKFIIDTTGTITEIENERVIVTKDYIYYRPISSTKRISLDRLLNIVTYKSDATWIIMGMIFFLLPSLFFYAYFGLFIKYLILVGLSSFFLYFIVRVLLLYEISFSNAMSSGFYAGTILIILESVFFPLNPKLMLPLFSIWGFTFYLVPFIVFFIFGILGMIIVEKNIHIGKKSKE